MGKQMRRLPLLGILPLAAANNVVMGMFSHAARIVIDHDCFPLAIDIERFGARLAEAVAGILHAAERHMWSRAVGRTVDRDQSGPVTRNEFFDAVAVEG